MDILTENSRRTQGGGVELKQVRQQGPGLISLSSALNVSGMPERQGRRSSAQLWHCALTKND